MARFKRLSASAGPVTNRRPKAIFRRWPTKREAERSIQRCATRAGVDECDLNLLTVLDAKRQRNVESELPGASRSTTSKVMGNTGSKDEQIAGADRSRRRFDQSRP